MNTISSRTWSGFESAPTLAASLLDPSTARYLHSAGVGSFAASLAAALDSADRPLLVAAGWLHDIGYSPAIVDTGFHPLDGARHLRSIGAPEQLCRLAAHHTAALVEARLRGLDRALLDEFAPPTSPVLLDALTYADLTTSPTGLPITVAERLSEILDRYPPDHLVHRATSLATPGLLASTQRVDRRIAQHRRHMSTDPARLSKPTPAPSTEPAPLELEAAREMVRAAKAQGLSLTGPDGLLKQLTKTVVEVSLEEEMTDHLGYPKHEVTGREPGNSRNGGPVAGSATQSSPPRPDR